MSDLEYKPFKNPSNVEILNAIRNNGTMDYQRRIPNADKANIDEVLNDLLNWTPGMNEFAYNLVNVIGLQIYKGVNRWQNPLAKFKRANLLNGDTIEEIMTGLLEAHRYDPQAEYLEKDIFGTERPEVQTSFHKINRRDYYKLSINRVELRKAFMSEFGLSEFINGVMNAPQTSDQWDEFLTTAGLLKQWHDLGGYFNVNIPDIAALGSDAADSKYALRRMRETADTLPFLSRRYNPAGMPVATTKDKLHLIITPEANAAMDVEALAGAFNVEYAEFATRKTVIPSEYIGIDGFQAMVTTDDFFVIADSYFDITSVNNPVGLIENYFLHHHQVQSVSRFEPAVLFTSTEESTPIIIQETPVVDIEAPTLKDAGGDTVTEVIRGMAYQIHSDVITDPEGGANNAARIVLEGAESPRTKAWQTGMFLVAIDETAETLTVNTVAVDNNEITSSATFDVVGDYAQLWPNPKVLEDDDNDGKFEVTPTTPTITSAGNVRIPSDEGIIWNKRISTGVTFTDVGDIVTIPHHGLEVGQRVKFFGIANTTGIANDTWYFVKTKPTANTVTLSATEGGATLVLTTNGTATSALISVADGTLQNVDNGQTVIFEAVLISAAYEFAADAETTFSITRS